jgi:hypothetical protein
VFPSIHISKSHVSFENLEIYLEGSNLIERDIFYFFSLEGNQEFTKSIIFNNTLVNLKDNSGKIFTNPRSYFLIISSLSSTLVLENFILNLENKCLLSYFIFIADNLESEERMTLIFRNSNFSSKENTYISNIIKKSNLTATFCVFYNFASFSINGEDSSLNFFNSSFFQKIFPGEVKGSSSFLNMNTCFIKMTRSIVKRVLSSKENSLYEYLFFF